MLFISASTFSAITLANISKEQTMPLRKAEEAAPSYLISSYDAVFQTVGKKYGIDWLLLAAIARAESQFRFDAVSRAGAVGLMQIMPLVAHNMGYTREALFDIRMQRAALLAKEKRPLAEIAAQSGYSDVFQLSRAFRRRFGYPPSRA